jgi:GT2 family glycosyltransferase
MSSTVPVAVFIPTYNRGDAVLSVLEKIELCNPKPAEIWVHIDKADGVLEGKIKQRFPKVGLLTSPVRLGPGGGRHRCLLACNTPYAVGFDDDSYPIDADFFYHVQQLFGHHPAAAIFGANIWHRNEREQPRDDSVNASASYMGCGHAIRLAAYREVRGLLPRPVPYAMEETDLSLQLFVAGWNIYQVGELRVFHDTDLKHHESVEINAGVITNVGIFVFLHFPLTHIGAGLLQLGNRIIYSMKMGRIRGICSGIWKIPFECYRHRHFRKPVQWRTLKNFLQLRKAKVR